MRKYIFFILIVSLLVIVSAQEIQIPNPSTSTDGVFNLNIPAPPTIINGTFNQTLGDNLYWRLDGTNDPPTAAWSMGGFDLNNVGIGNFETIVIDSTNAEALLVRQNSDTNDIFRVNTLDSFIELNSIRTLENNTDLLLQPLVKTQQLSTFSEFHILGATGFGRPTSDGIRGGRINMAGGDGGDGNELGGVGGAIDIKSGRGGNASNVLAVVNTGGVLNLGGGDGGDNEGLGFGGGDGGRVFILGGSRGAGDIQSSIDGIVCVGSTCTTNHGLDATNDLMVDGDLEVDGFSWFENEAVFASLMLLNENLIVTGNGTIRNLTASGFICDSNGCIGNPFDQILNTTSNVSFNSIILDNGDFGKTFNVNGTSTFRYNGDLSPTGNPTLGVSTITDQGTTQLQTSLSFQTNDGANTRGVYGSFGFTICDEYNHTGTDAQNAGCVGSLGIARMSNDGVHIRRLGGAGGFVLYTGTTGATAEVISPIFSKFNLNNNMNATEYFAFYDTITGAAGTLRTPFAYGLRLDDIDFGDDNFAIKTNAGKVEFGDNFNVLGSSINFTALPSQSNTTTSQFVCWDTDGLLFLNETTC